MCQAASQNFDSLAALRVLSGAFEAIADPAFMVIISTYYTREEQPWRIAAYYLWNGIGVSGGGLIGRSFPCLDISAVGGLLILNVKRVWNRHHQGSPRVLAL